MNKRLDLDRIFWGFLLLLAGSLILRNNMDVIDLSTAELFRNWWPSILILAGLKNLLAWYLDRK